MTKDCVAPPELDEKQLLMYLDGESDADTELHLQRCAYCNERAQALDSFQKRLTSRSYRINCPSSEELGKYYLNMLPNPQRLKIAEHIRICPLCALEYDQLRDFLSEGLPQPGLLESVKVLFARLVGAGTESGSMPGVGVLRGVSKGPLTFEADDVLITLDVQSGPSGQVSLLGQLAADDQDRWTGANVELQQTDSSQMTATLDDLGGFRFEKVPSSAIQITIKSLYGMHIQIPNIDIAI